MRVRAKTVTKTISKTLSPVQPFEFSAPNDTESATPPPQDAAIAATLPEDEQERAEVFQQVEEAVLDEGLRAFRELPLDERLLEESLLEESLLEETMLEESLLQENLEDHAEESAGAEQESVAILVQEEESTPEAGLVILGAPQVVPFVCADEEAAKQEDEAPVAMAETLPEAVSEMPSEVSSEEQPMPEAASEQPAQAAIPCPGRPYMVRRGDSFQLIARRFGVSVRALLDANPELQPGRLVVGDVLCVPLPETPASMPAPSPEPPAREGAHRVQEGESIADILLAGDVSLSAFRGLNPGLRLGQQRVGDLVYIPTRGARGQCSEGTPDQVAEGEDIAALATRHGLTVGMLLRANPHLLPSDFRSGQVVCVPKRE